MSSLLVLIGYHPAEEKFGKLVRENYFSQYGHLPKVLFYELKSTRNTLLMQSDEEREKEIKAIQRQFNPSLTVDIHHTSSMQIKRRQITYGLIPLRVLDDLDFIWMHRILDGTERGKVSLMDVLLRGEWPASTYNRFCLEAEIGRINKKSVRETATFLHYLFLDYSDFREKIEYR